MAVPKTTKTRCRDGSVQERQDIQTLHKYPHPYIFFFHRQCCFPVISDNSLRRMSHAKKRCRDGNICIVFVCPVFQPSNNLVE